MTVSGIFRTIIVISLSSLFTLRGYGLEIKKIQSPRRVKSLLLQKAFSGSKSRYLLFISKKNFTLQVYDRKHQVKQKYKIAYGFNPDRGPKLYEGDQRTPEGIYSIKDVLSLKDPADSDSHRELKALNELYLKAQDGFFRFDNPRLDLGKNAYGPRFYRLDYPTEDDKARYEKALKEGKIPVDNDEKPAGIGFGIAIHGNNYAKSIGHPASAGCILLHNRDIKKLDPYITKGMPVIITGD